MSEKAIVPFDPDRGFIFNDLDSMYRAAEMFLQTGFAPRGMDTPQKICAVWWRAAELGLRPLQALEGMNVINGRLGLGGDLALAKVRSMGLLVSTPKKKYTGTIGQDDYTCTVTIHRKGEDPQDFSFSIREAKQAGIYVNNWPKYPQRMVYYRALGFGLRDMFSDALKGMYISEELEDFQDDTEPPSVADEQKVAENQRREYKLKAAPDIKFVESHGKKPSPQEAVEPAFPEDAVKPAAAEPRTTPAFAEKLKQEYPQAKEVILEDTGMAEEVMHKDQQVTQQWPPQEEKISEALRPRWMDHVIRSIAHPRFQGKKISELDPKDLLKIETQWIPKIEADMDNANEDQKLEYTLFQSAIAHGKSAKPF